MADFELALSMMTLARTKATGVLEVEKAEKRAEIEWSAGHPVFATENTHGETLGRLLVRQGLLTAPQYEAAIQRMADRSTGDREALFGDTVVELGFLDSKQVQQALLDQLRWRIVRCLQHEEPVWRFKASSEVVDAAAYPFDVEPLILLAMRWTDPARLDRFLGAHTAHSPRLLVGASEVTSTFRLEVDENPLLARMDGSRSIKALLEEFGATLDARAILVSLLLTGTCTATAPLIDVSHTVPVPAPPRAPPPGGPPAPRPAPAARPDVTVRTPSPKVLSRMAGARVLAQRLAPHGLGKQVGTVPGTGIPRQPPTVSATSLGKQVGTGPGHALGKQLPTGSGTGLGKQLPTGSGGGLGRQLPTGSGQAHLPGAPKREGGAGAEQAAVTDPRLAAEQAFQAGKKFLHADDLERALVEFRRAASLLNASAEYRLYAQWLEWLGGNTAVEHSTALGATAREAAVQDPNLAFPRYVLGRLALAAGDVKHAKLLFKFAVKLDATLLDAQRYLRLIDLRKGAAVPAEAAELFKAQPRLSGARSAASGAAEGGQPAPAENGGREARESEATEEPPPSAPHAVPAAAGSAPRLEREKGVGAGKEHQVAEPAALAAEQAAPVVAAPEQPAASEEAAPPVVPAPPGEAEGPAGEHKSSDLIASLLRDATAEATAPAKPPAPEQPAPAEASDEATAEASSAEPPAGDVAAAPRAARPLAARWIVLGGMLVGCVVGGGLVYLALSMAPHHASTGAVPSVRPAAPAASPQPQGAPSASATAAAVAPRPTPSASAAPAPSSTAAPSAPPAAPGGSAAAASQSSGSTPGVLVVPASAGVHRVWVDGKLVGQSPLKLPTTCGPHTVQVGSSGKPYSVDVPCQ
jgi:hypothetical protein